MVVSMIEGDAFLGRICTGRITSGTCKVIPFPLAARNPKEIFEALKLKAQSRKDMAGCLLLLYFSRV